MLLEKEGSIMKTSNNGLKFIKQWEGCCLTSYQDGGGVWTIGFGHTKGIKAGLTITQQQADQYLEVDLKPVNQTLNTAVTVPVNQNQYDALSSFTFNLGSGALKGSTLLKLLNQGNYQGAADEFPKWCHDNGQIVHGLVNRRNAERSLFLS
jgi:lysozyme